MKKLSPTTKITFALFTLAVLIIAGIEKKEHDNPDPAYHSCAENPDDAVTIFVAKPKVVPSDLAGILALSFYVDKYVDWKQAVCRAANASATETSCTISPYPATMFKFPSKTTAKFGYGVLSSPVDADVAGRFNDADKRRGTVTVCKGKAQIGGRRGNTFQADGTLKVAANNPTLDELMFP